MLHDQKNKFWRGKKSFSLPVENLLPLLNMESAPDEKNPGHASVFLTHFVEETRCSALNS